jgi:hypothetical protein
LCLFQKAIKHEVLGLSFSATAMKLVLFPLEIFMATKLVLLTAGNKEAEKLGGLLLLQCSQKSLS